MKKGLSILLALTLLVSMMAPFAVSANQLPGEITITGDGSVLSFQTHGDILGGSLPTAANLNFVIDPNGLLLLGVGSVIGDVVAGGTTVDFSGGVTGGDVLYAWNRSSVPVVFSADLSLQVAARDEDAITTFVQPSATAINTSGVTTFDAFNGVVEFGTDGETVDFILDAVAYEIVVTDGTVDGSIATVKRQVAGAYNLHGTALRFAGVIDPDHNWNNAGTLGVTAIFSLAVVDDEVRATGTVPYGWVVGNPALVPVPAGVTGGGNVLTVASGGWVVLPGISVAPLWVGTTAPNEVTLPANSWLLNEGTLWFTPEGLPQGTHELTVIYTNWTTFREFTINVTAPQS